MPLNWPRRWFRQRPPSQVPTYSCRQRATFWPTIERLENREVPATFVVKNTADAGIDSLRLAITQADLPINAGSTIVFNIPGPGAQTILVSSGSNGPLPAITQTTVIDGWSEGVFQGTPGYQGPPLIVLDGSSANIPEANGLTISAPNCTVQGLAIVNFRGSAAGLGNGIAITNAATGTIIQGNYLGIAANGTTAAPNAVDGVQIFGSSNNTIGGTTAAARNIISGNGTSGVEITDDGVHAANSNTVEGNYIGLNSAGTGAVPNTPQGVIIDSSIGASSNIIGGTTAATRNVISGNSGPGVTLGGPSVTGTLVEGNYIGTDSVGTNPIGNVSAGVLIQDSRGNTIGGTASGAGNVISATRAAATSPGFGVVLSSDTVGQPASNNLIQGNFIGTDAPVTLSGSSTALPNAGGGVVVDGNAAFGGVTTNNISGNVISGNTGRGVIISGSLATGNQLLANFIGTQADHASPLGNTLQGVYITNGASGNSIGGANTSAANTIAFNSGNGVLIGADPTNPFLPPTADTPAGTGNPVLSNSIFANGAAGIATNSGQAPPTITQVTFSFTTGATSSVIGSLSSTPNTTFNVQIFQNPGGTTNQGQTLLGSVNVTTDGSGNATFSTSFPVAFSPGQGITATATSPANNTSPFSGTLAPNSDGVQGLAAYRPSNGSWSLDSNGEFGFQTGGTEGQAPLSDRVLLNFSPAQSTAPGAPTVIPVSGDWANLGTSEIGDFENGTWHLDLNNNGKLDSGETFQFGSTGDLPVPADWLSSNQVSLAVFRSNFTLGFGTFIISDANWLQEVQAGKPIGIATSFIYGAAGDNVVVGDWNGAGLAEVGVYRPAVQFGAPNTYVWTLDIANHRAFDPSNKVFLFGSVGDGVVIGDWNGSGTSKVGVYRPAVAFNAPSTAVFSLDFSGQFQFITGQSEVFLYGLATDKYVTGTWAYTTSTAPATSPGNVLSDPTSLGAFFSRS